MKKFFLKIACIVLLVSLVYVFYVGEKPQVSAYTGQIEAKSNLILVNRDHPVPEDFDLKLCEVWWGDSVFQVHESAYLPLEDLFDAAKDEGMILKINSAYRDADFQESLFSQKVEAYMDLGLSEAEAEEMAKQEVAEPMHSEHQTGLAIDFGDFTTYDWLRQNAHLFGFILRYPEDKTHITKVIYEPWHFRYVGTKEAMEIYTEGLTLEEYLSLDKL